MFKRIKEYLKKHSLKELFSLIDAHYGLGALETLLARNWLNPLYTLWLNLRSFPFRQAVRLPVLVYGHPRLYCLSGDMRIVGSVSFGMIKFNQTRSGAPNLASVQSELNNRGHIVFHGKGYIGTGTKIVVSAGKTLELGNSFLIADFCNIGVFNNVIIGEQSWIVHRCQILDSNYHYVADFEKRIVPGYTKPIRIGKGCWICNSSTITGGAVIPDYTIVASNSLVGKDYSHLPANSLIGGIPAKHITTGLLRVMNPEMERTIADFYREHPDLVFNMPEQDTPDLYSQEQ